MPPDISEEKLSHPEYIGFNSIRITIFLPSINNNIARFYSRKRNDLHARINTVSLLFFHIWKNNYSYMKKLKIILHTWKNSASMIYHYYSSEQWAINLLWKVAFWRTQTLSLANLNPTYVGCADYQSCFKIYVQIHHLKLTDLIQPISVCIP
jgi:hypothetical protein